MRLKRPAKTTICRKSSKRCKTSLKEKNNGLINNFKSIKRQLNKKTPKPPTKPIEKSGNFLHNKDNMKLKFKA